MKIPVFGGASGGGLLSDATVKVYLANNNATNLVQKIFPNAPTENGELVLQQTPGANAQGIAAQLIDKVTVESSTLDVIIYAAVAVFGLLVWLALRKK